MTTVDRHDWHSDTYVRDWVERSREEDSSRQRRFALMADVVPFDQQEPIAILDVGAGYAPLTRVMLETFPRATVVAQDYSEPMLTYARETLAPFAGRVSYVTADLMSSDWSRDLGGPFEAVVSSIAIHNLRSAPRIRELYAEIFRVVKDGGCFLNVDFVSAPTPALQRTYWDSMLARRRRQAQTDEDQRRIEEWSRRMAHMSAADSPMPFPASVDDQLVWLRDAGFAEVDCLWKEMGQALVAGFKRPA